MAQVLVIDNNGDFREIISRFISNRFDVSVITTPFRADTHNLLEADDLSLVISDVEDANHQGFWVHNYLRKFRPDVALAIFVDEHRLLRNIPQLDSTVRIAVLKPDFQKLCQDIEKLGLLVLKRGQGSIYGQ